MIALGVFDSGNLLSSLKATSFKTDSYALNLEFSQEYNYYGLYVDAGTGRGVPKGNNGDVRHNRKRRRWFYPKYYMSTMNIKEFFAESVGLQAVHLISNALSDSKIRKSIY